MLLLTTNSPSGAFWGPSAADVEVNSHSHEGVEAEV